MRPLIKILLMIVLAAVIWSLFPTAVLYLKKDPVPYTNAQAAERLKGSAGNHFGFIVFGDDHAGLIFNDSAALKTIRRINREDRFKKLPIDFVLVPGDISFRGSAWDYKIYNKLRSLIKWPVFSAVGNHDDDKDGGSLYKKYAGQAEYSFADRNSYFIVINNSGNNMSGEQFARFEEELKKSLAYRHRFVIAHKSPISPYQQSWYRPELSPWSYRFMKLCEDYKVDMVFSGHEHMFSDHLFGGTRYVVTGGGGMLTHLPRRDGGFLHYIVVRVYGDYVDYEVRKIFPPLWEYLAYYMWKDLFYFLKDVLY